MKIQIYKKYGDRIPTYTVWATSCESGEEGVWVEVGGCPIFYICDYWRITG